MNQAIMTLNEGWRFHYGDVSEAWYKGYDDQDWENVVLPHDWSVHMPFQKEYSSGTGYLAGGIGWYRLRFSLPEEYRGKRIRIVFDGIYKNSRIWCNSYHLGKRPYGYSEISYDITDFVNFGEMDNEISVQVTHTDLADSRWFTGSGIYRRVWLIAEEPLHPVLHGTQFRTTAVCGNGTDESAGIHIRAEFANDSECGAQLLARFRLLDADWQEAAAWESRLSLAAGETGEIQLDGVVKNPRLWSVDSPYLYTLVTELAEISGNADDPEPAFWTAQTQRVGIRTAVFDPDEGFFLNGENLKLKGVCVHHDGGCLGAAMTREVWLRRLLKLKDAGCNAIRTSHNPHMPELYDLCDELGFLMMDEAFDEWENPKNKWSTGHNVYPPKHQGYAEDFPQWYEADLTTMIRRDWNHPSIVLWSVGNEIDYPNDPYCHPDFQAMVGNNDADKPAAEMMYNPDKPDARRLAVIAARLANITRNLDSSRPVTLAAAFPELSSRIGFLDELDVVGYNYKEHLYEQDHARFPQKPFLGSENSHSYQAWRAVTDHPYISGQFLWTGIDYLGEAHGWPIHGSGAGLLDLAGNEKPAFYRRKAFWSEKPYLSLLTAPVWDGGTGAADEKRDPEWKDFRLSWNYEPGTQVEIFCFANVKNPELFLNETSLGAGAWSEEYGRYEWKVTFEPGVLRAVSYNNGEEEASCCLETSGPAARMDVKLWEPAEMCRKMASSDNSAREKETMAVPEMPASASENSAQIAQIEVALLDGQDRLAADEDRIIRAEVENGVLLGLENGDLADLTSYTENWRKTRNGRLVLYARPNRNAGAPMCVRVSCEELGQTKEVNW
ncbi:MAG: DUF4982 domain-containing protein [Lachnospiraceae bacterium]|nr:DUF4982 domain-containing protein [Lachnospiraceae bacterium]